MPNRQIIWIRAFGFIILMATAATWASQAPDTVRGGQGLTPTACTATIDKNLFFHIPYLSDINGNLSIWVDLVYDFNPTYPTLLPFKLTNYGVISNPSFSCEASALSNDLKIHIPDVLLPDESTHIWVDLEYSATLSSNGSFFWVVSNHGVVSNATITDKQWQWTEFVQMGSPSQLIVPKPEIYTLLLKSDGMLNARVDCNIVGGSYILNENSLTIKVVTSTMAYCGDQSLDKKYLELLNLVESYKDMEGNLELYLRDNSGTMTFKQKKF